jgi:hypothetical protein
MEAIVGLRQALIVPNHQLGAEFVVCPRRVLHLTPNDSSSSDGLNATFPPFLAMD